MSPYIVCIVTIDEIEKASKIAKKLLEMELVACVNIVPQIRSLYRWKGEIFDEPEIMMIMKTKSGLFNPLKDAIKTLHPYEVPEIIALNIQDGLPDYLDWIGASTRHDH